MARDPSHSNAPEEDQDEVETPFTQIQSQMDYLAEYMPNNFDTHVRRNMKLVSAEIDKKDPTISRVTFQLHITEDLCNAGGNLHGGCVALAFDVCTSMAITPLVRDDFWDTGHVSRILNCTYLRPAPAGSDVLIECETVHLGKRLCSLRGVMSLKSNGKICYTCEHQKAVVDVFSHRAASDGPDSGSEGELPSGHPKAKL